MTVFVNGERTDCGEAQTVEELVEHHQLHAETTLVEHQGVALHRREWPARILQENDRLEFLRIAAGG